MKLHQFGLFVAATVLLSGCSFISNSNMIKNRNRHYLEAESIEPLRIPPGMNSDQFANHYPVSARNDAPASKEVSLIPPGLNEK